MQDETPKTATTPTNTPTTAADPALGRSTVAKLPPDVREAVDKAIADGVTIDEITARIRAEGENCSRSAVGRYSQNYRAMMRQQQESDRFMTQWMKQYGERPQGQAGLILIETMRTMVIDTVAAFSERGEPVPMQELERLSRVVKRIEDTDKLRLAREQRGGEGGRGGRGGEAQAQAQAQAQASEGALAGDGGPHRRGRAGQAPVARAHRHVGAGGPVESCGIPLNLI